MFQTVEELNEAVRSHRRNNQLSKTELAVLDVLSQYSCVEPGVSYLCKNKIALVVGKSKRTIIRVCNRLESLGIIRQYTRMRETGDRRQTSNKIVIQSVKCNDAVTNETHVMGDLSSQETPSINSKNNIINNTYASAPSSPYARFLSMVNYFVDDRKLTNKLYGIYLAHTSYLRNAFDNAALLEAGIQAIKATFQATKRKKLRNIAGYYNGTLDRMLDRLYFEDMRSLYEG